MLKKKPKVKLEEAVIILKYLARVEGNVRAINFLDDRGVEWNNG